MISVGTGIPDSTMCRSSRLHNGLSFDPGTTAATDVDTRADNGFDTPADTSAEVCVTTGHFVSKVGTPKGATPNLNPHALLISSFLTYLRQFERI